MLFDFKVKNFACLREEQRLRLIATSDRNLPANTVGIVDEAGPRVVRSFLLYGANGSGKSTLFRALRAARDLALMQEVGLDSLTPFDFDESSRKAPVCMEISFIAGGTRCIYSFSCSRERVLSERLTTYATSRPSVLFSRSYDNAAGKYVHGFGGRLRGGRKAWLETAGNELLLGRILKTVSHLSAIRRWFESLVFVSSESFMEERKRLLPLLLEDEGLRRRMASFLKRTGTGVEELVPKTQGSGDGELLYRHGGRLLSSKDEAFGVRRLTVLLARLFHAVEEGGVVVLDGLEGLHPLVWRKLFSLFHAEAANSQGCQLCVASHETSLLQTVGSLFRRDQIWFMEKTEDGSSELCSLVGFAPRRGEAVERGYLKGRYGALP